MSTNKMSRTIRIVAGDKGWQYTYSDGDRTESGPIELSDEALEEVAAAPQYVAREPGFVRGDYPPFALVEALPPALRPDAVTRAERVEVEAEAARLGRCPWCGTTQRERPGHDPAECAYPDRVRWHPLPGEGWECRLSSRGTGLRT